MTNPYAYWKAALAGEKPKMFVDDPQCGFYRKGVYEKRENKARKRVGWEPVAIFMSGTDLVAVMGSRAETDRDKINELWSYIAGNPISEATYRAVAERGEGWPDDHETGFGLATAPAKVMAANEEPQDKLAQQLDEAKSHLPKYKAIDSDELASKARSLQQRFLDIRGDAKKHYETLNAPLLAEQKRIREVWFPLRDSADEHSNEIRTALGAWEDTKRAAAKRAQEAADKAARDHAEATRKAEEANQPPPPPPMVEKPNVPAPSTQIRGGSGRAGNVGTKKVVTAIDIDAVFKQFRDDPRMLEFLTDLAQRAVKLGLTVPGATVEEKADVK